MPDCIFCKIVKGEIPSYKIYEDEDFFVFLDINPITKGHVQIISKEHIHWVWDVPKYTEYLALVKRIALAQRKVFDTDWVTVKIYGEEVPHAHIWVFPQKKGGPLIVKGKVEVSEQEMKEIAERIKENL